MIEIIKFKTNKEKSEFPLIKKRLKIVLEDMAQYFFKKGYDFIITDLLEEEGESEKLKRVSVSHKDGRAADLRVRHLPKEFIQEIMAHFSKKYEGWSAISAVSGKPNLIIYHNNGNGIHFHIQIRPYKEEI